MPAPIEPDSTPQVATQPHHLYCYDTNREDLPVAVGRQVTAEPGRPGELNGTFALFADAEASVLFMKAYTHEHPTFDWHLSPSVERLLAKADAGRDA